MAKAETATGRKRAQTAITRPNQRWGMDFVSDSLADGRTFRALAIIDHYTRQCLAIEVGLSLPGRYATLLNIGGATTTR